MLLGHLTRALVHEINNPLFIVLALTEGLERAASPGTQTAERLGQVRESGLEIRTLVAAVHELARATIDGESALLELTPVVRAAVDLIRRVSLRKDIEIVERCDATSALVHGSRDELYMAFLAILVEAQQSTAEAGRIEVSVTKRNTRVVTAVRWQGDGAQRLDLLDRVLETIVEAHGGTLERGVEPDGTREAVLALPLVTA
jgi:signal transduction histidine kinase